MKKNLPLCLLLVAWAQLLPGQDYSPMAIEDALWLMYDPGEIIPGPEWEYFIKGDTVINDKVYKKVYQRNFFWDDSTYITPYPYIIEEEGLFGAIRDDTILRKVYMVRFPPSILDYSDLGGCPLQEEFLLYNFDIEPGDTLSGLCLFYGETEKIYIDSINSRELFGYTLRTIYCQSETGFGLVEYAERIGFWTSGVFYADWEYNSHRFLSQYCVGNDCDYLLGNKEPTESSARFRVYPNPAASHVRIDLADPAGSNHRFRITDSLGKIYLDEGFPHGASTHTVSVADWPTGVYSVQYLADGALWGAKPVVVFW